MDELSPIAWAILPLKKYAVFSGRAGRREFWWFILLYLVGQTAAAAVEYAFAVPKLRVGYGLVQLLFGLATLLPLLGVCVRRLHDMGRTGLWVLGVWFCSSIANGIAVGALAVGSTSTAAAFSVIKFGIWALLLAFCAPPGTKGPNGYGPDPRRASDLADVFA